MGGQQQKQQTGDTSISISHPRFKEAKLVTEGKEKQMQISMGVDEKQYTKWKDAIKKHNLHSEFLLLPTKEQFSKKGLCGDSGTLKLNYDNYSYLLTEEIYDRNGKKQKFQQSQLWYLLLNLLEAQNQVKSHTGGKVGDIRPHNIFLNAQGRIKVANVLSWPNQHTNYVKSAYDNEKTYLAPEQMVRIQMGTLQQSSSNSSEVFSIGFTILSAAMLEDFSQLYDLKRKKFDVNQADELLGEWRSNTVYSEIFTGVVSNLCNFEPEKRITDKELYKWIAKYKKPINEKEDFCIEQAPFKIEREIDQIRRHFPGEVYYQPQPIQQAIPYHNQPYYVSPAQSEIYRPPTFQGGQPTSFQGLPPHIYLPPGQKVLQQSQLPPEVRKTLTSPRIPSQDYTSIGQYVNRPSANGQTQLPPQLVGRVINEKYINPQGTGQTRTFQQGFVPQNGQLSAGKIQRSSATKTGTMADLWDGKIQQTLYVPRSNSAKKMI